MAGKEMNHHQSFSLDPSSGGCMLKAGVASAGDGLILSSFQVLEHRDDGNKAAHDLEHFLHPYGHGERLGDGNDGDWKQLDCHSVETSHSHETRSALDDMHALNSSSDHDGSSFLNDFTSAEMDANPDNQTRKLMTPGDNGIRSAGDDDENEDEEDDGEGVDGEEHKTDGFDELEVETPDLLTSHKQGFIEMEPALGDHGFMNSGSRVTWPQEMGGHARQDTGVSSWSTEEKRDAADVTHLEGSEASKAWDFLQADQQHAIPNQNLQLHHQWMSADENKMGEVGLTSQHCQDSWGPGAGAKMISASSNEPWDKTPTDAEGHHSLLSNDSVVTGSSHWSKQSRPVSAEGIPWMQDVGGVYPVESDDGNVCKMFQVGMAHPSPDNDPVSTVAPMASLRASNSCIAQWPMDGQGTSARPAAFPPSRQGPIRDAMCRRVAASSCLRSMSSHVYHRYPAPSGAQSDVWPQQGHSSSPLHPASPMGQCVESVGDIQPPALCPTSSLGKRAKAVVSRRSGVTVTSSMPSVGDVPKIRPLLEQARKQAHPYLMKDTKKGMRDVFPGTGANVHTLKASHIVSWYIDYLIHENEHLTQISRAFSLPVNLFHSDDFYFMESVKKKVHFPSLKFLSWMQQNLPSINVNAVDFHEGRPPVVSVWNQDWFWQNKSRRDIIHDVFFYFQHRRVTCPI